MSPYYKKFANNFPVSSIVYQEAKSYDGSNFDQWQIDDMYIKYHDSWWFADMKMPDVITADSCRNKTLKEIETPEDVWRRVSKSLGIHGWRSPNEEWEDDPLHIQIQTNVKLNLVEL